MKRLTRFEKFEMLAFHEATTTRMRALLAQFDRAGRVTVKRDGTWTWRVGDELLAEGWGYDSLRDALDMFAKRTEDEIAA